MLDAALAELIHDAESGLRYWSRRKREVELGSYQGHRALRELRYHEGKIEGYQDALKLMACQDGHRNDRIAALEAEVAELRAWRDEQERIARARLEAQRMQGDRDLCARDWARRRA